MTAQRLTVSEIANLIRDWPGELCDLTLELRDFVLEVTPQVAEKIAFLSILNYYKPFAIMQSSAWPVKDMLVLAGCGAVLWTAGGIIFARRDICTS